MCRKIGVVGKNVFISQVEIKINCDRNSLINIMETESVKKRVLMEYDMMMVSQPLLWNYLSTSSGLERWFADKVTVDGKIYEFHWSGSVQRARLLAMRSGVYVKMRWEEDSRDVFFEMSISKNELTGATVLSIVDFGEDEDDVRDLWNSQIEVLKRILGC